MDVLKVAVFLLIIASVEPLGPLCFFCSSTSHARYCDTIQRCSEHQVCTVKKVITQSGHIQYTSGCLDRQFCSAQTRSLSTQNGYVTCIDCCNGSFCNTVGCGDKGPPARDQRGPYCFDCDYLSSPTECEKVTVCQSNEICSIESYKTGQDEIRFSSHCKSKPACLEIDPSTVVGKRDIQTREEIEACNACCSDDFCNLKCPKSEASLRRYI